MTSMAHTLMKWPITFESQRSQAHLCILPSQSLYPSVEFSASYNTNRRLQAKGKMLQTRLYIIIIIFPSKITENWELRAFPFYRSAFGAPKNCLSAYTFETSRYAPEYMTTQPLFVPECNFVATLPCHVTS